MSNQTQSNHHPNVTLILHIYSLASVDAAAAAADEDENDVFKPKKLP